MIDRLLLASGAAVSLAAVLALAPLTVWRKPSLLRRRPTAASASSARASCWPNRTPRASRWASTSPAPSLAQAQSDAAQRMDAVVAKLKADGIAGHRHPHRQLQRHAAVRPARQSEPESAVLRGYQVQNMVEVKTTNVGGLGALLDDVVGRGRHAGLRHQLRSLGHGSDEEPGARPGHGQRAVEGAAAGQGRGHQPRPADSRRRVGHRRRDARPARPRRAAAAPATTTPIQPGQLQISTTIRVVWSIQ